MNRWFLSLDRGTAYLLITFFAIIIYLAIFAQPLPRRKQIAALLVLICGSPLLWFFHNLGLPVLPVLFVTMIAMFAVRIRLWLSARRARRNSERTKTS